MTLAVKEVGMKELLVPPPLQQAGMKRYNLGSSDIIVSTNIKYFLTTQNLLASFWSVLSRSNMISKTDNFFCGPVHLTLEL